MRKATTSPHKRVRGDNAMRLLMEQARMLLEEADDTACFARNRELMLQTSLQGRRHASLTNDLTVLVRRPRCCCRSGLDDDQERAQAKQYRFQNVYLLSGDRGAAHHGGRSCHA